MKTVQYRPRLYDLVYGHGWHRSSWQWGQAGLNRHGYNVTTQNSYAGNTPRSRYVFTNIYTASQCSEVAEATPSGHIITGVLSLEKKKKKKKRKKKGLSDLEAPTQIRPYQVLACVWWHRKTHSQKSASWCMDYHYWSNCVTMATAKLFGHPTPHTAVRWSAAVCAWPHIIYAI